jgi:hypothetical protein
LVLEFPTFELDASFTLESPIGLTVKLEVLIGEFAVAFIFEEAPGVGMGDT